MVGANASTEPLLNYYLPQITHIGLLYLCTSVYGKNDLQHRSQNSANVVVTRVQNPFTNSIFGLEENVKRSQCFCIARRRQRRFKRHRSFKVTEITSDKTLQKRR